MSRQKNNTQADYSAAVKGRVVSAGLAMGDLAEAAGIGKPTLSNYIKGRLKNYETQIRIYNAFCRLAGKTPTRRGERWFWGSLLNRAA